MPGHQRLAISLNSKKLPEFIFFNQQNKLFSTIPFDQKFSPCSGYVAFLKKVAGEHDGFQFFKFDIGLLGCLEEGGDTHSQVIAVKENKVIWGPVYLVANEGVDREFDFSSFESKKIIRQLVWLGKVESQQMKKKKAKFFKRDLVRGDDSYGYIESESTWKDGKFSTNELVSY